MKLGQYIKDKLGTILIAVVTAALIMSVLSAFDLPPRAAVLVLTLMAVGIISAGLLDFVKRKRFYDRLLRDLDELDQKYLIAEMTEEPPFYEGRLLRDVLYETDRSMLERVGDYRRESSDFRDYIELWVHEIKIPVAALRLMCHNDGNVKYARQIGRVDDLIENVLYYARSESAEKDYLIRETQLKRVVTETAVRCREELQAGGITFRSAVPDVAVMTDAKWLSFMLGQLMANSIKYAAPDRESVISVTADVLPDRTVLRFRDNGIGIAPSELPRVFEKSFTGTNGRGQVKSTGMGLYLVKKLCDKLGHGVAADSVQGEYTEISITFGKNTLLEIK